MTIILHNYFYPKRRKARDQEEAPAPFREGYAAAVAREEPANPYTLNSEEWAQWGSGWSMGVAGVDDARKPYMPKLQAGYVPDAPRGKRMKQCQDCNMFHSTNGGTCGLVLGPISPRGTCDFFERKEK